MGIEALVFQIGQDQTVSNVSLKETSGEISEICLEGKSWVPVSVTVANGGRQVILSTEDDQNRLVFAYDGGWYLIHGGNWQKVLYGHELLTRVFKHGTM